MQPFRFSFATFVVVFCLSVTGVIHAQGNNPDTDIASIRIGSLEAAPQIDGKIEESEWAGSAIIDQKFRQFQPDYQDPSPFRTVVRIAQTEDSLYIAFVAYDPEIDRLSDARTQRDSNLGNDDSVGVLFDSFNDKRTAYGFQLNALGTQRDFRIADNGRTVDDRWDAAWRSAAQRYEDRWVVEMEIPFAILKFTTQSDSTWGIDFIRSVPRRLEYSLWSEPSEAFYRVSTFGELLGVRSPAPQDTWQFIPYTLVSYE